MTPEPVNNPPTIIIVHPKERRSKCSVEPLRGRPDMVFIKYPSPLTIDPNEYVRLAIDGPLLEPFVNAGGRRVEFTQHRR